MSPRFAILVGLLVALAVVLIFTSARRSHSNWTAVVVGLLVIVFAAMLFFVLIVLLLRDSNGNDLAALTLSGATSKGPSGSVSST